MASNLQQAGNGTGNGCGACGCCHGGVGSNGNCKLTLYLTLESLPVQYYGHLYSQFAAHYQPAPASRKHFEATPCCCRGLGPGLDLDLDDAGDASASCVDGAGGGVNDGPAAD